MSEVANRNHVQEEESQNEEEAINSQLTPQLPRDRMWISEEERELAKQIKAAVAQSPEVDALPDSMYAQMAIVSRTYDGTDMNVTDMNAIIDRLLTLQQLREENGVVNNASHGCRMLKTLVCDLVPGSFLAYSYVANEESYVCSMDMTNCDMGVLSDPHKVKDWLAGMYYLLHAFHPDMESTRKGLIILAECEDYHWRRKDMVHAGAFRKWWSELALVYPFNVQKVKYFHTGLFMNLLLSTARKFLPTAIQQRMEVGCQSEGGRLDELFMVPDVETANDRLVQRLQEALRIHFANEADFVL